MPETSPTATETEVDSRIEVAVLRTNPGTSLVRDGQVIAPLEPGQTVEIHKNSRKARFVDNPATPYWRILQDKLRWAARPTYREGGVVR